METKPLPAVVLRVGHHLYPPVVLGGVGSFLELDVKAIRLIAAVDHLDPDPQGNQPRNVDAYHGGQVADELASLVSLALGVRLENGGLTRVFELDGDPHGQPIGYFYTHYRPRQARRFASDLILNPPRGILDRREVRLGRSEEVVCGLTASSGRPCRLV